MQKHFNSIKHVKHHDEKNSYKSLENQKSIIRFFNNFFSKKSIKQCDKTNSRINELDLFETYNYNNSLDFELNKLLMENIVQYNINENSNTIKSDLSLDNKQNSSTFKSKTILDTFCEKKAKSNHDEKINKIDFKKILFELISDLNSLKSIEINFIENTDTFSKSNNHSKINNNTLQRKLDLCNKKINEKNNQIATINFKRCKKIDLMIEKLKKNFSKDFS